MAYDLILIKELREAGFPFNLLFKNEDGDETYYKPSLSELIEACGDDLHGIQKREDGSWDAIHCVTGLGSDISIDKTPEEAVARLYLALNKKN